MRKLKTFIMLVAFTFGVLIVSAPLLGGQAAAFSAKNIEAANKQCASNEAKLARDSGGKVINDTDDKPTYECVPVGDNCKSANGCLKNSKIVDDIRDIVNALAAGVGVVVVGTIIVAGVQYIVAGDNPSGVEQAKKRIMNGLMALAAFFLTYAFLQWIIPGGIL